MQDYFDKINQLRSSQPIDLKEDRTEPLLDMLYSAYVQLNTIDSEALRHGYEELDGLLAPLPQETKTAVYEILCVLYAENERAAFVEGVRVGARLSKELTE